MGILGEPLARFGDADLFEQVAGFGQGIPATPVQVDPQRLGDLFADPFDRVEGCHGVLEHHGHLHPPEVLLPVGSHSEHVAVAEADRSFDLGVGRQQVHESLCGDRLARTGLADNANGLADFEVERDAVDGPDQALIGSEPDC